MIHQKICTTNLKNCFTVLEVCVNFKNSFLVVPLTYSLFYVLFWNELWIIRKELYNMQWDWYKNSNQIVKIQTPIKDYSSHWLFVVVTISNTMSTATKITLWWEFCLQEPCYSSYKKNWIEFLFSFFDRLSKVFSDCKRHF